MEALTSLFELATNLREYEVLADDAVATTLHLAANSWTGDNSQEVAASHFPLDKVNDIRKLKGVGKTRGKETPDEEGH